MYHKPIKRDNILARIFPIVCLLLLCQNIFAQDSLRFLSGTTGAACLDIKYHNGYLFAGTGSTFRVYDSNTPIPYQMLFEYRYQSTILDLLIRDNYLYLAANYDGLTKWDISNPANPVKIFEIKSDDTLPVINVALSGDSVFLAKMKMVSIYKDLGDHFIKIGDLGSVTGFGRLMGVAVKNGICAYTVADGFSNQNGVYLYRTADFSFLSHYIQPFCLSENLIWGENNNILHVLGGTNGTNGSFYSLDVSDPLSPQRIFNDTVPGIPFGWAMANPVKAVNRHDTIYVATTAAIKPNGPLDTTFIYAYDATNPANIHFLAYLPAGLWHFDLDLNYPLYYVASEWYGIKTVDYSNFFHCQDQGNTLTGGWNLGSDKYENYLAIADEGYGFKLFDVTQLTHPVFISSNNDPGFSNRIKFSEDGMYIYGVYGTYEGFRVYDRNTLSRVGEISSTVGTGKCQVYGQRVYVQQEGLLGNYLNVINVSAPSSPFVERKIPAQMNVMFATDGKLFIVDNDSILVYDISSGNFDLKTYITLPSGQDATSLSVYGNEVFVYITQRGLVKYLLTQTGSNISLNETGVFQLSHGAPSFMAADTFGIYLAYQVGGLYACDRQTLAQKSYFRGELDTKGYSNQYGIQDLYCKDDLIFLSEYFSQTSILTNDDHYPFGINDKRSPGRISVRINPNPLNDKAIIHIGSSIPLNDPEILIEDISGKQVRVINQINQMDITFERGYLQSGVYIIKVVDDGRIVAVTKVIIL